MFLTQGKVVLIDHRCAGSGTQNSQSYGDKHQAGDGSRVALSLLIDNGVGDEEHV